MTLQLLTSDVSPAMTPANVFAVAWMRSTVTALELPSWIALAKPVIVPLRTVMPRRPTARCSTTPAPVPLPEITNPLRSMVTKSFWTTRQSPLAWMLLSTMYNPDWVIAMQLVTSRGAAMANGQARQIEARNVRMRNEKLMAFSPGVGGTKAAR